MPAIFISYRRKESSGYSGRIYDRLRGILGSASVFMDAESIEAGADWRRQLEERIAAADVVLVLIGADWLTLADDQGRRRLDDPQDITRWEIESALGKDKRTIPVLLPGAAALKAADLPASLGSLAKRQHVEIRHESFDAGLENLLARITGEDTRGQLLLERAKRWGIPAIVAVAAVMAWLRAFDFATLDTRAATWTLALADMVAPIALDESIVLIGIDGSHDASDPQMRARYAAVLTRLADAQARAVIMDLYFHGARDGDEILAGAMRAARERGTEVYFAFIETRGDAPRAHADFLGAATRVGLACIGRKLGYAVTVPIAFGIRATAEGLSVNPLPSLALIGAIDAERVDGVHGTGRVLSVSRSKGTVAQIEFSMLHHEMSGGQGCGAIAPGTRTAELMVRTSPVERLRGRRLNFDDVLAGRVSPERMANKTVLIGYETPQETFTIARGLSREQRYGYELHADSINALKARRIPRFVDIAIQALTAGALAALGASLGVHQRKLQPWKVWLTVLVPLAAYAAIAIALAAADDILLYSVYDIVAFLFAFALFRHLTKRFA